LLKYGFSLDDRWFFRSADITGGAAYRRAGRTRNRSGAAILEVVDSVSDVKTVVITTGVNVAAVEE
jgi:hypothetical protein